MEVRTELEEPTGANKTKGKPRRPHGPQVSPPAVVAEQTGRLLTKREPEWLERLVTNPASFAVIEREVHDQARRQADLYVAGLLAKASDRREALEEVTRLLMERESIDAAELQAILDRRPYPVAS